MSRLVRAEWTKLFTTRVWIGLLLGGCAMAGGFAALFTAFAGQTGRNGQGLPRVWPLLLNWVGSIFNGNGLPCSALSRGLGSNVSTCDGPPSM